MLIIEIIIIIIMLISIYILNNNNDNIYLYIKQIERNFKNKYGNVNTLQSYYLTLLVSQEV